MTASRCCAKARLVQIGTPEEIWRRPADTFVARSLGQPEINILDGVVDDGRIRLGGRLARRRRFPPDAVRSTGDRVRVGLRPCDIHVGAGGPARCAGTVMLAERLGRNVELTVDVGGEQVIVLASGREGVDEGADVTMTVADSDVHVFAAGDGDTATARRRPTRPWRQHSERDDMMLREGRTGRDGDGAEPDADRPGEDLRVARPGERRRRSRASTWTSSRASWSRCSARPAAARPRRCG